MKVTGLGNPGWTFTLDRMNQINNLFDFIQSKNSQDKYNYKEMQAEASKFSNDLNPSKVRMFIPWFERFGIYNYSKNVKNYGNLLTELGKQFATFCPIYTELKNEQSNHSEDEIKIVCDMYQAFMFKFFENILLSDRGALYKQIIVSLEKHCYLTKKEFYIITTKIANGESEEWLDNKIQSYRNGEFEIDSKKIKNQNVYGYTIPFCCEAGITILDKDNRILPARDINFEGALKNVK